MKDQQIKLDLTELQVKMLNTLLPKAYKLIPNQNQKTNKRIKKPTYKVNKSAQFKRLGIQQNNQIKTNENTTTLLEQFGMSFNELFEQIKIFLKGFNFKDWSKQLTNYAKTLTMLTKKTSIKKYGEFVQIIKQQIDSILNISTPFKKTLLLQKQFTVWKLKKVQNLKKRKCTMEPRRQKILKDQILQMKTVLIQTIKQQQLLIYQILSQKNQKLWTISKVLLLQQKKQQQQFLKIYKVIHNKMQVYPQEKQRYSFFVQPYLIRGNDMKQINQICLQLSIYGQQIQKFFINLQKIICEKYQNLQMFLFQKDVQSFQFGSQQFKLYFQSNTEALSSNIYEQNKIQVEKAQQEEQIMFKKVQSDVMIEQIEEELESIEFQQLQYYEQIEPQIQSGQVIMH